MFYKGVFGSRLGVYLGVKGDVGNYICGVVVVVFVGEGIFECWKDFVSGLFIIFFWGGGIFLLFICSKGVFFVYLEWGGRRGGSGIRFFERDGRI